MVISLHFEDEISVSLDLTEAYKQKAILILEGVLQSMNSYELEVKRLWQKIFPQLRKRPNDYGIKDIIR